MTEQLSLLAELTPPRPAVRTFTLTIRGRQVRADFQKNYCDPHIQYDKRGKVISIFATHHIEFRTKRPGPISESGYRSYFLHGTFDELGITDRSVRRYVQKVAEWLADTYEKEAPERKRLAAFAKQHGWKRVNGGYR